MLFIRLLSTLTILSSCALTLFALPANADMKLSSTAISGGKIDQLHACSKNGGKNKSIPIDVKDIPVGTSHLAIIMDDPDARPVAGKIWVHWNVFNIAANSDSFSLSTGENRQAL